jgi:hypothetical protein
MKTKSHPILVVILVAFILKESEQTVHLFKRKFRAK